MPHVSRKGLAFDRQIHGPVPVPRHSCMKGVSRGRRLAHSPDKLPVAWRSKDSPAAGCSRCWRVSSSLSPPARFRLPFRRQAEHHRKRDPGGNVRPAPDRSWDPLNAPVKKLPLHGKSLLPAREVSVALRPVLRHSHDCALCVLDKLHTGSFHGEAVFRVREQRDLALTRIDHEAALL